MPKRPTKKLRAALALMGGSALALPASQALATPASPASSTDATTPSIQSVRPLIIEPHMNVFRRFATADNAKMVTFYKDVLGLRPMPTINLGGGMQVMRFQIGQTQFKLAAGLKKGRQYHPGAFNTATGIRLYTLFFPDAAALTARFKAAGYAAPQFKDIGSDRRAALVRDPGGFTLELVVAPHASPEVYGQVEVGINVSNLAASRAFYRDFVGLEELPPVKDPLLGVTKYPFRNGTTTINLWSVGAHLPADTGSGGMQYIVSDDHAVAALAKERDVAVEAPLAGVPGFNILTIWLNDPDGVTNYFYQMVKPDMPAKSEAK